MLPIKLCFINVYTYHNPTPTLTVMQYSNYMLYSRLWIEGTHLVPETNNKYLFLPIRLCFINVYTNPNPIPSLTVIQIH